MLTSCIQGKTCKGTVTPAGPECLWAAVKGPNGTLTLPCSSRGAVTKELSREGLTPELAKGLLWFCLVLETDTHYVPQSGPNTWPSCRCLEWSELPLFSWRTVLVSRKNRTGLTGAGGWGAPFSLGITLYLVLDRSVPLDSRFKCTPAMIRSSPKSSSSWAVLYCVRIIPRELNLK